MASIEQAQKLILELLKDFEEDTLEILRHSPVAVRMMRVSDRHITFANPRYMEMFKVEEKDLQTLTPLQVYQNNWAADWSAAKHYISNVIASEDAAGNIQSRAYFQAVFMRSNTTHMLVGRYDDTLVVIDGDLRIQQKRLFIEGSIDLPETSREISRFSPFARVK